MSLINITDDGYWVDADGRRWRLVPVTDTPAPRLPAAVGEQP